MAKIVITAEQIRANLGISLVSAAPYPYERASCATCPAACCRKNVGMPLTDEEAEFMRSGGTELVPIDGELTRGKRIQRALGMSVTREYRLGTDCGFLVQDGEGQMSCIVHEDEKRPEICRVFEQDSHSCHELRYCSKLETLENVVKFDAATRE